MGTRWEISVPEAFFSSLLEKEIFEMSDEFDKLYSRFKQDSVVTQISHAAGTYTVPDDFVAMLSLYQELYEPSEKKLNPLIGFALSDLGYDHTYSLREKEEIRKVPDLLETVTISNSENTITTTEPVLFDFGALGKGYFVDKIATFLKGKGCEDFLVNGSGDVYYFGEEAGRFGLEDPEHKEHLIGVLTIPRETSLRAFCASGTNRRQWPGRNRTLNHELDATTLESANYIVATWVQAKNTALADALTTCLFFCSPENFKKYSFEYLIMNKNREIKKSPGFQVELY